MTFDEPSTGTVSAIFYEWADFPKLGKASPETDRFGYQLSTYICTTHAVQQKLCRPDELGSWITQDDNATGGAKSSIQKHVFKFPTPDGPLPKTVEYNVTRKGYYCVGASE